MLCDSFKLDNDYLADYNIYIGSNNSDLLNETFTPGIENTIEDSVIGLDGGYFYQQRFTPRIFSIPCFFIDIDETKRREIQKIFTFRKNKKLILDRKPYAYINVLVNKQIDWRYVWHGNKSIGNLYSGFFEVEFIAVDPLWYGIANSIEMPGYIEDIATYPDTLFYDSGMLYLEDLSPSYLSNIKTSPTNFQLYNGGNYKSKCNILIVGSGTNISIKNITSGKSCTISSLSSENILINGQKGQISDINGLVLKTSKFSGYFINIESGMNDMQITGTNLNLVSIQFIYRYTYL